MGREVASFVSYLASPLAAATNGSASTLRRWNTASDSVIATNFSLTRFSVPLHLRSQIRHRDRSRPARHGSRQRGGCGHLRPGDGDTEVRPIDQRRGIGRMAAEGSKDRRSAWNPCPVLGYGDGRYIPTRNRASGRARRIARARPCPAETGSRLQFQARPGSFRERPLETAC